MTNIERLALLKWLKNKEIYKILDETTFEGYKDHLERTFNKEINYFLSDEYFNKETIRSDRDDYYDGSCHNYNTYYRNEYLVFELLPRSNRKKNRYILKDIKFNNENDLIEEINKYE